MPEFLRCPCDAELTKKELQGNHPDYLQCPVCGSGGPFTSTSHREKSLEQQIADQRRISQPPKQKSKYSL